MDFGTSADVLKGTSTALSAVSSLREGSAYARAAKAAAKQSKSAAKFEAGQYIQQAGQERATAQRQSIEERRAARLAESRAIAVAAASGGGASDPTVTKIVGNLAAQGEYNALSALYTGEEAARGLETAAMGSLYEGNNAASSYRIKGSAYRSAARNTAIGTALDGIGSFFEKYGGSTLTDYSTPAFREPGFRPPGIR